jgi:DNA-binding MarR family transcriptional regulator
MMRRRTSSTGNLDEDVDAMLRASRALVGVAARSLANLPDDLTLPQFRVLVLLAQHGASYAGVLAEALGVHPSSVTRLVDRLEGKGLVTRQVNRSDRREIAIELTAAGRAVVDHATADRRSALGAVLRRLTPAERAELVRAFGRFALAAGEAATESWSLGWTTSDEEG